jgi:peptidase M48-like protein
LPRRASQPTGTDAGAAQLFRLSLLVAAGGLSVVAVAIARAAGAVQPVPGATAPRFTVLDQGVTYPRANAAGVIIVALAALGLFVLLRLAGSTLREAAGRRRFARSVAVRRPRPWRDVVLLDDPVPQAFCAGLLRPRIYLSTATVRGLEPDELEAVLAHERHHRLRRDPLRVALARALADAFFFLPVLRRLGVGHSALAELAADDAAVRGVRGGAATLASALLSFGGSAHPRGAVGVAPERVDHLLGRTPAWRLPAAPLVAAAITVLLLALTAWQLGRVAVLHASLDLPFFSARPCVVLLALGSGAVVALAAGALCRRAR